MSKRGIVSLLIVLTVGLFLVLSISTLLSVSVMAANAQCSGTINTCTSGNFSDSSDNSTHYLWKCTGTSGGTNASCSLLINSGQSTTTGDTGNAEDSYQCLTNKVANSTSLSLQDAIFSTLALGNKANLIKIIEDNKNTAGCWPKDSCKLKDTALVGLAYHRIGKDTSAIKSWLISKNVSASDLTWYIEIDINDHTSSQCKVKYDGVVKTIQVNEDMTLTGDPGNCLSVGYQGNWLSIKTSCLDKTFEVSCDKDFITTLIFERTGRETKYVTSETHSGSGDPSGSSGTTEKVNSKCLKISSVCDYEGTLWAALALQKEGVDVSSYIPYLMALADDNEKYFPSAFLYLINGGNENYAKVIDSQKQGKYWEITSGNRYYDTSVAFLALYGSNSNEFESARQNLLNTRTKDKCWNNNNIKDTAFILYSGWPKSFAVSNPGNGSSTSCSANGYFCSSSADCLSGAGTIFNSLDCPGIQTCCSIKPEKASCSSQSGVICSTNQECDGNAVPSLESGTCCIGTCKAPETQDLTCETLSGRTCRSSCDSNTEIISADGTCSQGLSCCEVATLPEPSPGKSNLWIWIILLVVLIILVVLGILYKDKIRMWWFKYRGKAKTTPVNRPGSPPGMMQRPVSRPIMPVFSRPATATPPRQMPPPPTRPSPTKPANTSTSPGKKPGSDKDKEMEETLRKLREMSK